MVLIQHSTFQHVLIVVLVVILAVAAGLQAGGGSGARYEWACERSYGATQALKTPSWLFTSDQQALIWHSLPTGITFSNSSGSVPILDYPDVTPRRWITVPATEDTYHIIWLEADARLRSALIDYAGQTVRGPIDLTLSARRDFAVIPQDAGRALVLWVEGSAARLMSTTLDSAGRPLPVQGPLLDRVGSMVAAYDQTGKLHLAWLHSPLPNTWTFAYQVADGNQLAFHDPGTLHSLTLAPEESITSFTIGLDQTYGYLVWGVTNAETSGVERIHLLTFLLNQPTDSALADLQLPQEFTPSAHVRLTDPPIGYLAPLAEPSADTAPLRWPQFVPQQESVVPLAITLRTKEGWRPAVVYFRGGMELGYQIIASRPADAAPPALARDPLGDLHLAWLGLAKGSIPTLYTATTDGRGLIRAAPPNTHLAIRALAGVTTGFVLGLLWLIIPTAIVLLSPRNTWTIPLAVAVYGAGKLLCSFDLFLQLPPMLSGTRLAHLGAGSAVGLAILIISFVAVGAWGLAYRFERPRWQQWFAYALTDILLTWAVFGPNGPTL